MNWLFTESVHPVVKVKQSRLQIWNARYVMFNFVDVSSNRFNCHWQYLYVPDQTITTSKWYYMRPGFIIKRAKLAWIAKGSINYHPDIRLKWKHYIYATLMVCVHGFDICNFLIPTFRVTFSVTLIRSVFTTSFLLHWLPVCKQALVVVST